MLSDRIEKCAEKIRKIVGDGSDVFAIEALILILVEVVSMQSDIDEERLLKELTYKLRGKRKHVKK